MSENGHFSGGMYCCQDCGATVPTDENNGRGMMNRQVPCPDTSGGHTWSVEPETDRSGRGDGTERCELCGESVESLTLTADSHPEGPNHPVGQCCVHAGSGRSGGDSDAE